MMDEVRSITFANDIAVVFAHINWQVVGSPPSRINDLLPIGEVTMHKSCEHRHSSMWLKDLKEPRDSRYPTDSLRVALINELFAAICVNGIFKK